MESSIAILFLLWYNTHVGYLPDCELSSIKIYYIKETKT